MESSTESDCLRCLNAAQTLLKTPHLLFHYPKFDIQGFMKLHEPIDVGCQPADSLVHESKSFVQLFAEIAKLKVDQLKSSIRPPLETTEFSSQTAKPLVSAPLKTTEFRTETTQSHIRLPVSGVYLSGPRICLSKSSSNQPLQ